MKFLNVTFIIFSFGVNDITGQRQVYRKRFDSSDLDKGAVPIMLRDPAYDPDFFWNS